MPAPAASIFGLDPRMLMPTGPYDWLTRESQLPQKPTEPDFVYALRQMFTSPVAMANREAASLGGTLEKATSTPNSRAKAAAQAKNAGVSAASVFPNSYADPVYDAAEARAAQITGVPVELLRGLRTRGERSNNNQVSSAGAKSPYQIIPDTAAGIKKNYGIDPFSSPENAAISAAYVAREQANLLNGRAAQADVDWNDPKNRMAAVRGYHGGQDPNNWGSQNAEYTQRVLGPDTGLPAPFVNPFNSQYHQQALAELDKGQAAALKPSVLGTREEAPGIPDMIIPAKADFSQADHWLADMKPVEMMETEKKQIEREGWFKGLAQAASSISGGEGIGTMFLRLGAGSLGGAMAGKDEVRARMDQFDKKMTQWQLLNFQNEGTKANVVAQEARQEAALLNEHAMNKFRVAYGQWEKDGPQVLGDAVITTKVNEDGTRTMTRTPLAGPIMSAFALHRAQTLSAIGGLQNNANSMVASATNGLLANEAAMMTAQRLSGASGVSGQEAQDAMVTAQASAATNAVKYGPLADIIAGEDDQKALFQEVDTAMQGLGLQPSTQDYAERREMMIAERLLRVGLQNKEVMERIMNAGGAGLVMSAAERFQNRTERQSVDSKGRPTSSTTYRGQE